MAHFIRRIADIESIDEAQRAFLDYLFDFEAIDDADALLSMLTECGDELPDEYCDSLGLAAASSFADAASLLGSPWGLS